MVMPPSVEVGDQVAESDLILSEIATLFRAEDPEDGGNTVSVVKGIQLLQAIKNGDIYTFESLLIQSDTSLRERDGKKRTPLLLAASLGKGVMVKMLLAEYADARSRASSDLHTWQQSFIGNAISSQWETDDHRTIDLSTADKLGRTTLHYCAEFEMYDEAKFLLDHDVDANARDNCGYPPVYYAVKNRKYYATKLLSARTTVFRLPPTPTSNEITKVLEETSRNRRLGPMSNLEVPRHNSVSVLPRDSGRFSPLPQRRRSN